jgi:predicted permease
MIALATLRCWWKAIVHRSRTNNEIETETSFHIDEYANDLMRNGMQEEEARRQARLNFGRADFQKEKYREAIGLRLFDEMGADIRYGLRALLRNPGFAGIAILSLAIGIGATTAMFSLIHTVLLHPFPYADSERITNPVVINEKNPDDPTWFAMTRSQFLTLGHANSIESLLGFSNTNAEITGNELPEDVQAIYLTENADSFFGVHALLGRNIEPHDAQGGGQPVVVLNYRFWQRYFHGDLSVIGHTIQVDRKTYTIVGVMPRNYAFNDTLGVGDLYFPHSLLPDSAYVPWIKIKRGTGLATADADLGTIVHQFAQETPKHFPKEFHVQLQPIVVPYEQKTGRTLYLLLAGVIFVLLIGCGNCSILFLARGTARQQELAVRRALGASRWRIIRQLLVEALVISFAGATLGVAASWWFAALPLKLSPNSFPAESVVRISLPVLMFCITMAFTGGILSGLAPALRLSRPRLALTIKSATRTIAGGNATRSLNLLIAVQTALTLLLMAAGATAIGAFLHVTHVRLGYDPHNVLNAGIMAHWNDKAAWSNVESRSARAAWFEQIRRKMAAVPGVLSVGVSVDVYPPYGGSERKIEILGHTFEQEQNAQVLTVGTNYFSTLRITLLGGQIWDDAENLRGDGVAVVNETFARRFGSQGNPIGLQIRIPDLASTAPLISASSGSSDWRTVIGVVGDIPNDGLDHPVRPAVYVPFTTLLPPYAQFNIRTQGNPITYLEALRTTVASIGFDQQISKGASTLEDALANDSQWSRQRLFSVLFGCFSAMALLLALIGLFSVVSYSVTQRTAEFGIRVALGAPRIRILWTAIRPSLLSAMAGIAVGMAIDLSIRKALNGWMQSGEIGIASLFAATLLFVLCAFVACLLPAGRAARINPVEALRYE